MKRVVLSEEDRHFLDTAATGLWGGATPEPKDVNELSVYELIGKAGYCISAKKYELATTLLKLAESKVDNAIDLHYCYSEWINLTYKQRENPELLNLCIEYCKKDIAIFPRFQTEYLKKFPSSCTEAGLDIRILAFERLAIIYEKQGDIEKATKVCELALFYNLNDSTKGGFEGRLEKLRKKL